MRRGGPGTDPETKAVVFSQVGSAARSRNPKMIPLACVLGGFSPLLFPGSHCQEADRAPCVLAYYNPPHPAAGNTTTTPTQQFTSFLDEISAHLHRAGWPTLRLDGTMPHKARTAALASWRRANTLGAPRVLLVSLRAGGTGLNLTSASHCFLMDLWWNEAAGALRPRNMRRFLSGLSGFR